MAKVKYMLHLDKDSKAIEDITRVEFYCPGCKTIHNCQIEDNESGPKIHAFNDDFEKPTFTPSISNKHDNKICHSFITDGKIFYVKDCTHGLAGQTVELPELKT